MLLYHITHIERLAGILRDGALLSDAALQDRAGTELDTGIGYDNIKQRRLTEITVPCCEGRFVGTFVPFYFCPRSPMLYTVNQGNTGYPRGCQSQIVHLVTTTDAALATASAWAFSDGNAGAFHANFYNDMNQMTELDWAAIRALDWRGRTKMHRKMAEFLVADRFPWSSIQEIGCMSSAVAQQVRQMVHRARPETPMARIETKPSGMRQDAWYY